MAARRQYFWKAEVGEGGLDVAKLWPDIHPAELDRMRVHLMHALAEHHDFELDHRAVRDDGTIAWLQQRGIIDRDQLGKAVAVRGIATDITERRIADQELRDELSAALRLQAITAQVIGDPQDEALYAPFLDAAVIIMHSDFASLQVLDPERNELLLLGHRGFTPTAADHWRWVGNDGTTPCSRALISGHRVVIADIDTIPNADPMMRHLGIRAVQSTPLFSRTGELLGVTTTHWRTPYTPTARELRLYDMLARQAAHLLERVRDDTALRAASLRDAFRVALTDALRQTSDPIAIQSAASRLLGEYLQVSRAYYAELDVVQDTCTIGDNYFSHGAVSMGGTFRLGVIAHTLTPEFRAGKTCVVNNCRELAGASPELIAELVHTGRIAYISVPLIKAGQLVGGLSVQDVEPRTWRRDEVALVEETAERTWSALERVRSQAALAANEERVRLAVEAGGMGTWMVDLDRGVSVFDASLNRMLGFEAVATTQAVGSRGWEIHPDDRGVHVAAWRHARKHGTYSGEYRVKAADGSWRWLVSRGRVVTTGKSRQLFGITLDITERKQLEDSLRQNDRRKDEFLATLAHELRNPLAPLVTGLEVLRMSNDPAIQHRMRTMMEDQTKQLVRLVGDLLDVARINEGKIRLEKSRVELQSIVSSVVEAMRPTLEAARHRLELAIPEEPIALDADRTRIAQILTNLLTNAARYTPDGGVIELVVDRYVDEVAIRVRDNGIGMSPELLARVFDVFVQGDGGHGLGIGLALVKRMVELHGGSARAHSDGDGKGSSFEIRLPSARSLRSGGGQRPPAVTSAKQRILVVDDNIDAARALTLYLKMLGNEVEMAADGRIALDVAQRFQPNVILMDLGMPNLDGLAAARELRRLPWGSRVRLIAVTGWGQDSDRKRTREAGFDVHLVKPVDPDVLSEAIAG